MPEYIEYEPLKDEIFNDPDYDNDTINHFLDVIDSQPSTDVVKVVHGEWKFNKDGSGTCNQCGITQKNVWDYDSWQNYCGHCGADMRGTEKRSTDV